MRRRRTPAEAAFPWTAEFAALASVWSADASRILLGLVWEGYDRLRMEVLPKIDCRQDDRDLERNITQLLELYIRRASDAEAPFCVQHNPYEEETALPPPAQPPQYDLAFVIYDNPRVMWPLEAKILRTDSAVATYVRDINHEFLTCRYSPFSEEGAMLGYLVHGVEDNAFIQIGKSLSRTLAPHSDFPDRPHRISDHLRQVPEGKAYPKRFRCHHLVLRMAA